ncbi:MAG TPA: hypothetical protein VHL58_05210 [Thermoanaerobaculia bacterium]|nr:hypothetical protein [Thermoanaerobaculia bacterium]
MPFFDIRASDPPPLTRAEKIVLWSIGLALVATRFAALSRTLWDWDECLFVLGTRQFNPALHQPHPPGFPFYIALAKVFRLFMHDDFRALQRVNLIAASLLFPAAFRLGRELRLSFATAVLSAVTLCLMPNVVYFGGTAFSDVPSLTLVLAASAFLLAGCRSSRAFLTGTLLLALAMAIRPQCLVIALVPGLLATLARWKRKRRDIVVALLIGVTVLGVSYGLCVRAAGGWKSYGLAIQKHRDYFIKTDTYRSPSRPPVRTLVGDFLVHPYKSEDVGQVIFPLAVIGLAVAIARREHWFYAITLGSFLPFAVFALFMVDPNSVTRYSIAYVPIYALFAGRAMAALGELPVAPRWRIFMVSLAGSALSLWLIFWAVPVVRRVTSSSSPPLAAIRWIRSHLTPSHATLYVENAMEPFATAYLPEYRCITINHDTDVPLEVTENAFLFQEGATPSPPGHNFFRHHGRLFRVARQRYFEVSVAPLSTAPHYGRGWYSAEGLNPARWMSGRSELSLPALGLPAQLEIEFEVPLVGRHPTVSFFINGRKVADAIVTTSPAFAKFLVPQEETQKTSRLTLVTSAVANPAHLGVNDDDRDLGLMIHTLTWKPVK